MQNRSNTPQVINIPSPFCIHCSGVNLMLCPEELAAAVTATAISISRNLSSDDIEVLAAALTQLADTLVTISTAKEKAEHCNPAR